MSNDEWYLLGEGDQPVGPFSTDKVRRSIAAGKIPAGTKLCESGASQWSDISKIPAFQASVVSIRTELPDNRDASAPIVELGPTTAALVPTHGPLMAVEGEQVNPETDGLVEDVLRPLEAQLRSLLQTADQIRSRRELLDGLNPLTLGQLLRQGADQAKLAYGRRLSPLTRRTLNAVVVEADVQVRRISLLWDKLDDFERNGHWAWFKAGMSDEAQQGASIGGILGPWGAVVGSVLGGFLAGSRVEQNAKMVFEAMFVEVAIWHKTTRAAVATDVALSFAEDLRKARLAEIEPVPTKPATPPSGSETALGCGVILMVLALPVAAVWGVWRLVRTEPTPAVPAASLVLPTSSPPRPQTPVLQGLWKSDAGAEYDALYVAGRFDFRLRNVAGLARQGYQVGEVHFSLTPRPDDSAGYDVQQKLRVVPPSSVTYDDTALPSCHELVEEAGGKTLRGDRDADHLRVELFRAEAPLKVFVLRGTKVIECRNLSELRLTKGEVTLTRSR